MENSTDSTNSKSVSNIALIGYTDSVGGSMSRLLISKEKEEKVQSLLALLKGAERQTTQLVEINKSSIHELVGLVQLLLDEKAVVLEDDLSPAEAAEIAKVSRPTIMHFLKTGKLKGYPVKSQWRIKKESLLKYIEDRDSFSEAMAQMDKDGFGLD